MTTYSLTLNDKEPKGKALIALLKKMDDIVLKKTKDESPYDPEFVAKIKNAMNQEGRIIDPKNIWESIK